MKTCLLPCVLLVAAAAGGCAATTPSPLATSTKSRAPLPSKVESLIGQVQALADAGRHADVIKRVDAELPRVSDGTARARLQVLRGRSQLADGKLRSATLSFQRAFEDLPSQLGPQASETLQAWGDAQSALGRWRDAGRNYARALDAGPATARAKEELLYSAYVAAREGGDTSEAGRWKSSIRRFSTTRLAAVESRLLPASRAEVTPPVSSSLALGEIPDDPTLLLPEVHRRADWGASPVRSNVDPMLPVTHVTVHHSAMPTIATWPSAVASEIRDIQSSHQEKGWADIGYHFIIDAGGGIWEGRPLRWQGAHEGAGLNRGAVGVCLMGNFDEGPVPAAQRDALTRLLDVLCRQFTLTGADIRTHREVRLDPTDCPGRALQELVESYRRSAPPISLARQ